jgi:hypothetical protein
MDVSVLGWLEAMIGSKSGREQSALPVFLFSQPIKKMGYK